MPISPTADTDDTITGTNGDDTLIGNGGNDRLFGRMGNDLYRLDFSGTLSAPPSYVVNESYSGGGSTDMLSVGYYGLAQVNYYTGGWDVIHFARSGRDGRHLVIDLPTRPQTVHDNGFEGGSITVQSQFNSAHPEARIEILQIADTTSSPHAFNLEISPTGSSGDDIIVGWRASDSLKGLDGNDYIAGGRGADTILGGAGSDTLLGGDGWDFIRGGTDGDLIFSESGNDLVRSGSGDDTVFGGSGNDRLRGWSGNDMLAGEAGDDHLYGSIGTDTLVGGEGNDTMYGGEGRDVYSIDTNVIQSDLIVDIGTPPSPLTHAQSYSNRDVIELLGFASRDEAFHNVTFARSGNDLVLTYTHPTMAAGESGEVAVRNHFVSPDNALELVSFGPVPTSASYLSNPSFHVAHLSGDNFTYSVHNGADVGGEDIVLGTSGNDEIYGGLGPDILSGFGGSDIFVYQFEDGSNAGNDIILDFDPANDVFNVIETGVSSMAGITVTTNGWGNAVVSSVQFNIELVGVSAAEVTADLFIFV